MQQEEIVQNETEEEIVQKTENITQEENINSSENEV